MGYIPLNFPQWVIGCMPGEEVNRSLACLQMPEYLKRYDAEYIRQVAMFSGIRTDDATDTELAVVVIERAGKRAAWFRIHAYLKPFILEQLALDRRFLASQTFDQLLLLMEIADITVHGFLAESQFRVVVKKKARAELHRIIHLN